MNEWGAAYEESKRAFDRAEGGTGGNASAKVDGQNGS